MDRQSVRERQVECLRQQRLVIVSDHIEDGQVLDQRARIQWWQRTESTLLPDRVRNFDEEQSRRVTLDLPRTQFGTHATRGSNLTCLWIADKPAGDDAGVED